jgi:hypothetical protein
MKLLHRPDLFGWSRFDESRNLDFHSVLWVRPGGNVAVDPLPLSEHDAKHLEALGGAALVIVTNSDHTRDAAAFAARTGAEIAGPRAERETFPIRCSRWLGDGDAPVPGVHVLELAGSKTPGELALLLDGSTLVTGDLVRAHRGGGLDRLPDAKLADRSAALGSIERLAALEGVDAVLPGDGWPVFRDGRRALAELVARERQRHPPM